MENKAQAWHIAFSMSPPAPGELSLTEEDLLAMPLEDFFTRGRMEKTGIAGILIPRIAHVIARLRKTDGLVTLGDLIAHGRRNVLSCKNCGPAVLAGIESVLEKARLQF